MSDPIIDRLDRIKGRADKATEGPWAAWTDQDGQPHMNHMLMIGNAAAVIPEGDTWVEGVAVNPIAHTYTPEDREFIAAARTDVPRMETALRAVLDHLSQWQVPDPCGGPRDQWCPDCLRNDEIRQAVAGALGVETEGEKK